MHYSYDGIKHMFDKKFIDAEYKPFGFPPGLYEVREINNTLKIF